MYFHEEKAPERLPTAKLPETRISWLGLVAVKLLLLTFNTAYNFSVKNWL